MSPWPRPGLRQAGWQGGCESGGNGERLFYTFYTDLRNIYFLEPLQQAFGRQHYCPILQRGIRHREKEPVATEPESHPDPAVSWGPRSWSLSISYCTGDTAMRGSEVTRPFRTARVTMGTEWPVPIYGQDLQGRASLGGADRTRTARAPGRRADLSLCQSFPRGPPSGGSLHLCSRLPWSLPSPAPSQGSPPHPPHTHPGVPLPSTGSFRWLPHLSPAPPTDLFQPLRVPSASPSPLCSPDVLSRVWVPSLSTSPPPPSAGAPPPSYPRLPTLRAPSP